MKNVIEIVGGILVMAAILFVAAGIGALVEASLGTWGFILLLVLGAPLIGLSVMD